MVSKLGAGVTGALSGAATGASIGSAVPGIGTGIGAGVGGLIGGLGSYFSAEPDKFGQVNTQTEGQQGALQQLLSSLQGMSGQGGNYEQAQNYLGQLLSRDPAVYDKFAAPYMQQFEQQTIPRLAEQYGALGGGLGGGVAGSSGFGQGLGAAASNFQTNLAGMFANLQRGAATESLGQYNQLANLGLGTQAFQPTYQPGSTGLAGGLTSGLAQGAGQYGGQNMMQQLFEYLNKNNPSNKTTGIPSIATAGT